MKVVTVCSECGSRDIEYIGNGKCFCKKCETQTTEVKKYIESPQERTRRAVYATGNKWAIENFEATH